MAQPMQSAKMMMQGVLKSDLDGELVKMMYEQISINGGTYCRAHLRISCHICEVNFEHLHDSGNDNREELGLRPVGDAELDKMSEALTMEVSGAHIQLQAEQEPHKDSGGWKPGLMERMRKIETDLNAKPLAQCSQCAYFKCGKTGDLKRCVNCKIVKYCSPDHQRLDWKWEHKAECQPPKKKASRKEGGGSGKKERKEEKKQSTGMRVLSGKRKSTWYEGIERNRVYERFDMSFQLRVEDEYVLSGDLVGVYGEQVGGGPTTEAQFFKYFDMAKKQGLLPPDWAEKDMEGLLLRAVGESTPGIHNALEVGDVVENFSRGEALLLRSIARDIIGPAGWMDLSDIDDFEDPDPDDYDSDSVY